MKSNHREENNELKQAFLSSAIADISSYIHLVDTKVSIIMAAVAAVIAAMISCIELIIKIVSIVDVHSCSSNFLMILGIVSAACLVCIFVFGIMTIRSHSSSLSYKSKWYLPKPNDKYAFEEYKEDVHEMNCQDIIDNMAAELYKLNDINRQKQSTYKWVLRSFSVFLITVAFIVITLIVLGMKGYNIGS